MLIFLSSLGSILLYTSPIDLTKRIYIALVFWIEYRIYRIVGCTDFGISTLLFPVICVCPASCQLPLEYLYVTTVTAAILFASPLFQTSPTVFEYTLFQSLLCSNVCCCYTILCVFCTIYVPFRHNINMADLTCSFPDASPMRLLPFSVTNCTYAYM